jgi:hypothetical protein
VKGEGTAFGHIARFNHIWRDFKCFWIVECKGLLFKDKKYVSDIIFIGAIYFLSIVFLHSLNMIMMHITLKHCQDVARLDFFSGCVKQ